MDMLLAGDRNREEQAVEDSPRYLDELMRDLRHMNQIQLSSPELFRHVGMLLTKEIERVWSTIFTNGQLENSNNNGRGPARLPPSNSMEAPVDPIVLQDKILIPTLPSNAKCNLIGRILGPCGMSVKKLEAQTGCFILIRGKGSVKNPTREARLHGKPGWEHLSEPLHVLVTAKDTNQPRCELKLRHGMSVIAALLTPQYDDYKKKQLVQLAIINGTYRSSSSRME